MKPIGGYFELELNKGEHFHKDAKRLNSGRSAFEYVLLAKGYTKVYIPFFTCDVILEPIKKNNIEFEFYEIDEKLEPKFDFQKISKNETFLYTNYFGFKDHFIYELSSLDINLIIDNSQSFFSKPELNVDTFYSPRKFFGVPDGAYLYCNKNLNVTLEKDQESLNRMSHLLIRHDSNAESGYTEFKKNDSTLDTAGIKKMSNLTSALLCSIDYSKASELRLKNYTILNNSLENDNLFQLDKIDNQVPMIYPFWTDDNQLRNKLIENRVFSPVFWPSVKDWSPSNSLESRLVKEVIYLPLDQRYSTSEMNRILDLINK